MSVLDPNIALGSLLVAIPATIAAIATLRTNRNIKTNHGRTIGQHVEAHGDQLRELESKGERLEAKADALDARFELHALNDELNFKAISEGSDTVRRELGLQTALVRNALVLQQNVVKEAVQVQQEVVKTAVAEAVTIATKEA